ncbi:MAG: hypothetical protein R6X31_06540 [Anaerolineae bacterium]
MEKKFRVLHIIGTLWKVFAWITLIGGILLAIGILLAGILGSGGMILRQFSQDPRLMPGAVGVVSGIAGFIITVIATVIYFLILYAVGELIDLLLAIEENTRQAVQLVQHEGSPEASPLPYGEPRSAAAAETDN